MNVSKGRLERYLKQIKSLRQDPYFRKRVTEPAYYYIFDSKTGEITEKEGVLWIDDLKRTQFLETAANNVYTGLPGVKGRACNNRLWLTKPDMGTARALFAGYYHLKILKLKDQIEDLTDILGKLTVLNN